MEYRSSGHPFSFFLPFDCVDLLHSVSVVHLLPVSAAGVISLIFLVRMMAVKHDGFLWGGGRTVLVFE